MPKDDLKEYLEDIDKNPRGYFIEFQSKYDKDEDGELYSWRHGRYTWEEAREALMKELEKPRRQYIVYIVDLQGKKVSL